jgi:hypothetical protein
VVTGSPRSSAPPCAGPTCRPATVATSSRSSCRDGCGGSSRVARRILGAFRDRALPARGAARCRSASPSGGDVPDRRPGGGRTIAAADTALYGAKRQGATVCRPRWPLRWSSGPRPSLRKYRSGPGGQPASVDDERPVHDAADVSDPPEPPTAERRIRSAAPGGSSPVAGRRLSGAVLRLATGSANRSTGSERPALSPAQPPSSIAARSLRSSCAPGEAESTTRSSEAVAVHLAGRDRHRHRRRARERRRGGSRRRRPRRVDLPRLEATLVST